MNIITRSLTNFVKTSFAKAVTGPQCSVVTNYRNAFTSEGTTSLLAVTRKYLESSLQGLQQIKQMSGATLWRMHRKGPYVKERKSKNPFGPGKPFAKGVVLKTLIKKPKKPNSANRKCVLVRLSTGREMVAYIPGEGHNLQEHNIVLCRVGRCKDVPGVKIKCVRGKYDLPHVIKNPL